MSPGQPDVKPWKILYSALDNYGGYPFIELFDLVLGVYHPDDMKVANSCLILWGGGDISPSMYGQLPSSHTGATKDLSSKDQLELALAAKAIKMGIPIIGICRGAQMMCALAGGSLIQNVDGHGGTHPIITDGGQVLNTTSLHHQMMYPWEVANHKLIAWSAPPRSPHYIGGKDPETEKDLEIKFPETMDFEKREPEIIYFPEVKSLCIQGHPEFINNEKHPFVVYSKQLVDQYLISPFLK